MTPQADKKRAEFTIANELGLHFRAAALLVRALEPFSCEVKISTDEASADARSVLDLMTLAASHGTAIVVEAEGTDAEAAMAAVATLITNGFDE